MGAHRRKAFRLTGSGRLCYGPLPCAGRKRLQPEEMCTTMGKKTAGSGARRRGRSRTDSNVVIVESPAKARTIKKFLGPGFRIEASMGHVRDLPTRGRGRAGLGIDVEHGYKPEYQPIKGREKTLSRLRSAAESAQAVYLAPDPDREGEAIAWHVAEALSLPEDKTRRITFNAITKREVTRALDHPREIDMNLVNAQQARRVLDRLVGFKLSPLLWKKVAKGLSAGRVQSVAVRMVAEREREIQAFQPEEYWRLTALLSEPEARDEANRFEARLVSWQGRELASSALLDAKQVRDWAALAHWLAGADPAARALREAVPEDLRERLSGADAPADGEARSAFLQALNRALAAAEPPAQAPGAHEPRVAELCARQADPPEDAPASARIERNRLALEACLSQAVGPCGLRLSAQSDVDALIDTLREAEFRVADLEEKPVTAQPSPPFITSTLQQAASTQLRFGTSRTMRLAQQLYEGIEVEGAPVGLITYMRTDSPRVAPEAIQGVRAYLADRFSPEYLPDKPRHYASKKGAQEAHEAVRPTDVTYTPERVKSSLSADQYKLYDLIWRRFVASQMAPSRHLVTTARIRAGEALFEAKGRKVVFDGYTAVWTFARRRRGEDEDQALPHIGEGDLLDLHKLTPTRHLTKPPPRYSEASLVQALERQGIGRPSTYAPIVKTIQDRGYVHLVRRYFHATELGMAVTDLLVRGFPSIMDYRFTAQMEADLDHIEEGRRDWVRTVDEYYKPFARRLEQADQEIERLKGRPAPGGETCPLCQSPMVIRYSRQGAFLSCTRFPDCKGTRPLDGEGPAQEPEAAPGVACPECGAPMVRKQGRRGPFLSCSRYPECKKALPLDREGNVVRLPDVERTCELCGKSMVPKMGRRGPFLACTGYPECKNTKPLDKQGNVVELPEVTATCEQCGAPMVVRQSRRGPFLGCTKYPKCRNTKPLPKDATKGKGSAKD